MKDYYKKHCSEIGYSVYLKNLENRDEVKSEPDDIEWWVQEYPELTREEIIEVLEFFE